MYLESITFSMHQDMAVLEVGFSSHFLNKVIGFALAIIS